MKRTGLYKPFLYSVLILASFDGWLVAQNLSFSDSQFSVTRTYTTENGLPGNSTTAVIQDSNGYIWLSGFNGLVRYDGYRFITFNMDNVNGLDSNRFVYVTEGDNGAILAGLENGSLLIIRDGKYEVYTLDRDQYGVNISINSIHQDMNGIIWLGTEYHIFQLIDGTLTEVDFGFQLSNPYTKQIVSDHQFVYLLFERSIIQYDPSGETYEPLLIPDNETNRFIYRGQSTELSLSHFSIFWRMELTNESILLTHSNGITELSKQEITPLLHAEDLESSMLHGLFLYNDYYYVYGSDGLFRIDDL